MQYSRLSGGARPAERRSAVAARRPRGAALIAAARVPASSRGGQL